MFADLVRSFERRHLPAAKGLFGFRNRTGPRNGRGKNACQDAVRSRSPGGIYMTRIRLTLLGQILALATGSILAVGQQDIPLSRATCSITRWHLHADLSLAKFRHELHIQRVSGRRC